MIMFYFVASICLLQSAICLNLRNDSAWSVEAENLNRNKSWLEEFFGFDGSYGTFRDLLTNTYDENPADLSLEDGGVVSVSGNSSETAGRSYGGSIPVDHHPNRLDDSVGTRVPNVLLYSAKTYTPVAGGNDGRTWFAAVFESNATLFHDVPDETTRLPRLLYGPEIDPTVPEPSENATDGSVRQRRDSEVELSTDASGEDRSPILQPDSSVAKTSRALYGPEIDVTLTESLTGTSTEMSHADKTVGRHNAKLLYGPAIDVTSTEYPNATSADASSGDETVGRNNAKLLYGPAIDVTSTEYPNATSADASSGDETVGRNNAKLLYGPAIDVTSTEYPNATSADASSGDETVGRNNAKLLYGPAIDVTSTEYPNATSADASSGDETVGRNNAKLLYGPAIDVTSTEYPNATSADASSGDETVGRNNAKLLYGPAIDVTSTEYPNATSADASSGDETVGRNNAKLLYGPAIDVTSTEYPNATSADASSGDETVGRNNAKLLYGPAIDVTSTEYPNATSADASSGDETVGRNNAKLLYGPAIDVTSTEYPNATSADASSGDETVGRNNAKLLYGPAIDVTSTEYPNATSADASSGDETVGRNNAKLLYGPAIDVTSTEYPNATSADASSGDETVGRNNAKLLYGPAIDVTSTEYPNATSADASSGDETVGRNNAKLLYGPAIDVTSTEYPNETIVRHNAKLLYGPAIDVTSTESHVDVTPFNFTAIGGRDFESANLTYNGSDNQTDARQYAAGPAEEHHTTKKYRALYGPEIDVTRTDYVNSTATMPTPVTGAEHIRNRRDVSANYTALANETRSGAYVYVEELDFSPQDAFEGATTTTAGWNTTDKVSEELNAFLLANLTVNGTGLSGRGLEDEYTASTNKTRSFFGDYNVTGDQRMRRDSDDADDDATTTSESVLDVHTGEVDDGIVDSILVVVVSGADKIPHRSNATSGALFLFSDDDLANYTLLTNKVQERSGLEYGTDERFFGGAGNYSEKYFFYVPNDTSAFRNVRSLSFANSSIETLTTELYGRLESTDQTDNLTVGRALENTGNYSGQNGDLLFSSHIAELNATKERSYGDDYVVPEHATTTKKYRNFGFFGFTAEPSVNSTGTTGTSRMNLQKNETGINCTKNKNKDGGDSDEQHVQSRDMGDSGLVGINLSVHLLGREGESSNVTDNSTKERSYGDNYETTKRETTSRKYRNFGFFGVQTQSPVSNVTDTPTRMNIEEKENGANDTQQDGGDSEEHVVSRGMGDSGLVGINLSIHLLGRDGDVLDNATAQRSYGDGYETPEHATTTKKYRFFDFPTQTSATLNQTGEPTHVKLQVNTTKSAGKVGRDSGLVGINLAINLLGREGDSVADVLVDKDYVESLSPANYTDVSANYTSYNSSTGRTAVRGSTSAVGARATGRSYEGSTYSWTNCASCGLVQRNRIVGGRQASIKEFPWMVAVRKNGVQHCGASILNQYYVLTAAHCLSGHDPTAFVVVASVTDVLDTRAFKSKVEYGVFNKNFDPETYDYDVAVLKLAKRIPLGEGVVPICLPAPNVDPTGHTGMVSGWGALFETATVAPEELWKVGLPIVTNEECQKSEGLKGQKITERMMCAGYPTGAMDACAGDSGGPMVWQNNGVYEQVGIVSWGIGCARPKYFGVYTRVTSMLDWITEHVPQESC